jgi:TetR/AcrR family transcriptional repressor of nem operon
VDASPYDRHHAANQLMAWPKGHRAQTRDRILQAAAAAFRAGGIQGVRVEDVMAGAGLTHGGFYAHFASKDELLRESLRYASGQTVEMLSTPLASTPRQDQFRTMLDMYLSPMHAAHPERGCPLATLGPEVARSGGAAQRDLATGLRRRLDWMRGLLPETQENDASDPQVIGTLACMVGGLILARAAGNRDSDAILAACREFLHQTLDAAIVTRTSAPAGSRKAKRRARSNASDTGRPVTRRGGDPSRRSRGSGS